MITTTFWPIVTAGIVSALIGWVWYHPRVFGSAWMRMSGITPEMAERGKKNMPLYASIAFVASMLIAYVMNYFVTMWWISDWRGAVSLGFWCWAGFVAPTMIGMVLWDHKPVRLYLINTFYWLVAFIAIALVLLAGSQVGNGPSFLGAVLNQPPTSMVQQAPSLRTIHLGDQAIRVSVADTPESRQKGLSGRAGLAPDEGILFVFPQDGKHGFWMKDMRFSIDILWLNADGRIVHIAKSVSPSTYPQSFVPTKPARYVLEVLAGYVTEHGVAIGDVVRL